MSLPAELDECLLRLSLKLWNRGVPLHCFPPKFLSLLPRPSLNPRPAQTVAVACVPRGEKSPESRSLRATFWGRTRSLQFLYEAQHVSAIEGIVYRVVGHHLPPELVSHVSTFYLNSLNMPCSANFKHIWTPWPRHLTMTSENVKIESLRRELLWNRVERRFVEGREPSTLIRFYDSLVSV
jgi:hypothetical protein